MVDSNTVSYNGSFSVKKQTNYETMLKYIKTKMAIEVNWM